MAMRNNIALPVIEHFPTIQGEGAHSGSAAYFIRLGGCDVGCHWCDVKESWPVDAHPKIEVDALVHCIIEAKMNTAVITGGEPTMHSLSELTDSLQQHNIACQIETSGTNNLTGHWDWVTFSPKKFKAPVADFGKLTSELKVVVFNKSDFEFAEHHALSVKESCELYLQPEWDKRDEMMPLIVEYIKKHPKWKVSLQTHKYLNIP